MQNVTRGFRTKQKMLKPTSWSRRWVTPAHVLLNQKELPCFSFNTFCNTWHLRMSWDPTTTCILLGRDITSIWNHHEHPDPRFIQWQQAEKYVAQVRKCRLTFRRAERRWGTGGPTASAPVGPQEEDFIYTGWRTQTEGNVRNIWETLTEFRGFSFFFMFLIILKSLAVLWEKEKHTNMLTQHDH